MFALLSLMLFISKAGAQTDSLHLHLDSATFVSEKRSSMLRTSTAKLTQIDIGLMQSMPKILGNTDPMHFVRLLPGVQTSTEFDSGVYVCGCDDAHNEVSVSGVPLFGVNHMLGFFSVFNTEHYGKMTFSQSSSSSMLGGTLRMELPDTLSKRVSGSVSVGIMSSQGSVGVRFGEKSHLRVSARQSYMNLLYKRWLRLNDSQVKYGFGDYNLTYLLQASDKDKVWVDGYWGMDRASMDENTYDIGISLNWGNYLAAIHWAHEGEVRHKHSLSSSGYKSVCDITQGIAQVGLQSYINAAGYKGDFDWKGFFGKAGLMYYRAMPQFPVIDGMFDTTPSEKEIQNAVEGTLTIGYEKDFADRWNLMAAVKSIAFFNPEYDPTYGVTPDFALSYDAYHLGKYSLAYGWQHQNLFQTGFSNVGLPMEFWFLAGKHSFPQYSQNVSFSYDLDFCRDMFSLSLNLYYKWMYNQIEYNGDIFDFFLTEYDLDKNLLKGRGWNYGANIMLHKQSGSLTGWVSYSWGRALRRFNNPEYTGVYPANHERIHEFNAVCSYKYRSWDFAGTFICASGRPFTAPESYYLSSGKIIMSYGEHNACRMRPYIRMDVSVTYALNKNEKYENGLNFSIYNVLARRNDVLYKLNINDSNQFAYTPLSFMLRVVPSISYYHKF